MTPDVNVLVAAARADHPHHAADSRRGTRAASQRIARTKQPVQAKLPDPEHSSSKSR